MQASSSAMSTFLLLLVCVGALAVLGAAAVAIVLVLRKSGAAGGREGGMAALGPPPPPRARDVLFLLRFEGSNDEQWARQLVTQQAPEGQLARGADVREAALALARIAGDATHAYVAPAEGDPSVARCAMGGGVVVGFRARMALEIDTVADDADATRVAAALRAVSSMSEAQLRDGVLRLVETRPDVDGPELVSLRGATLPGQKPCDFCGKPMPVHETQCPHCGGRPRAGFA